jgi:hypothetical protein
MYIYYIPINYKIYIYLLLRLYILYRHNLTYKYHSKVPKLSLHILNRKDLKSNTFYKLNYIIYMCLKRRRYSTRQDIVLNTHHSKGKCLSDTCKKLLLHLKWREDWNKSNKLCCSCMSGIRAINYYYLLFFK